MIFIYFKKWIKPTAYLEIVQGVAAFGPLNEWTSGSSGMEAGAKVQLEGVDASGGFGTEISVTENVTSRWVDFKVPLKSTLNFDAN